MSSPSTAHVFVGFVAAVLVIWVLVPPLMVWLRQIRVRATQIETPAAAEPNDDDPAYRRLFDQLAALGFQPAGINREVGWFLSPWDWRKQFNERWLAMPDGQTFASVDRMIPEEPWRYGMVTLLSDGSVARARCPGVDGMPDAGGRYNVVRLVGADPAALLARHREHVEALCRERGVTVAITTFPDIATREAALGQDILNIAPNAQGPLFRSFFLIPTLLALTLLGLIGGGLRWVDFAYAGAAGAICMRLVRDFVVMPTIRMNILASHSEPPAKPAGNGPGR